MNDRAMTLAGGLISVVLIIGLLVPQGGTNLRDVSLPTSEDRGMLGLYGLKAWLESNNIPTRSLRARYQALLLDPDLADNGNLIVINQPAITAPNRAELEALNGWLSEGNYALILTARQDMPDWVKTQISQDQPVLAALGLEFNSLKNNDQEQDDTTETDESQVRKDLSVARSVLTGEDRKPSTLLPILTHPVLKGVESIASQRSVIFDQTSLALEGTTGSRYTLPLLTRSQAEGHAFWSFRHGNGGGWVSSQPDLFGNHTLGLADNARLFNNLINHALSENGVVIFDDMHLGLSDLYDAENFFSDQRLHHTLWFIGLFWLVYLIGYSNRLAPVKPSQKRHSSIEFVEAMAGYFARRIKPLNTARSLLEQFHSEVRHFYRQPYTEVPVTQLLRNYSPVREKDLRTLDTLSKKITDNKSVNLIQLTRTIDRIKRMMK